MLRLEPAGIPVVDLRLAWRAVAVPPKENLYGFVAGQAFTCWVHQLGPISKPCHLGLVPDRAQCPYCEEKKYRLAWKAYLPLFTEDKAQPRVVVVLCKTTFTSVGYLEHLQAVKLFNPGTRDHKPIRLFLDHEHNDTAYKRSLTRRHPVDIRYYLLHLWQDHLVAAAAGMPLRDKCSGYADRANGLKLQSNAPNRPLPPEQPSADAGRDAL